MSIILQFTELALWRNDGKDRTQNESNPFLGKKANGFWESEGKKSDALKAKSLIGPHDISEKLDLKKPSGRHFNELCVFPTKVL